MSQLILSSTMLSDWNALVDGASAHVNFGEEEIVNGAALLLAKERTVIEIPPTLDFTEEAALPECYVQASERASILV
jgi:c-di-GMP-related signal transduction protein